MLDLARSPEVKYRNLVSPTRPRGVLYNSFFKLTGSPRPLSSSQAFVSRSRTPSSSSKGSLGGSPPVSGASAIAMEPTQEHVSSTNTSSPDVRMKSAAMQQVPERDTAARDLNPGEHSGKPVNEYTAGKFDDTVTAVTPAVEMTAPGIMVCVYSMDAQAKTDIYWKGTKN